jgi:hypothetical protein
VLEQLAHQPALADAGPPEHGHHLRDAVTQRPVQGVDQQPQLVLAVDQRGRVGLAVGVLALHRRDREPHLGRRRAAAQGHRRLLLEAHRVLGQRMGGAADQDAAGRRHGLQPGGGVDHVAGDDRLAPVAGGGDVDQRLAGGDPDPEAHAAVALPALPLRRGEPGQHPLQLQPRALTASPMYFSTTPPYWPTTRRAAEKKPVCMLRTSSGSARST